MRGVYVWPLEALANDIPRTSKSRPLGGSPILPARRAPYTHRTHDLRRHPDWDPIRDDSTSRRSFEAGKGGRPGAQRTTSGPGEPGDRGLAAAGSESIEGTFQVKWGDPPDGPPVMKFSVAESGT